MTEKPRSVEILSNLIVYTKYAKYMPGLKRRETWEEICTRYEDMMLTKYPTLSSEIVEAMRFVRNKKILPSMRAMQFAGPAIDRNPSRIYNCAYLPIDDYRSFSEAMFLLLGGTGVGYSVQRQHVAKLPKITIPSKKRRYLIGDSIEGWADAVKVLLKAYFGETNSLPLFDYRDIREKGARLITAGGKAPGPEPLKMCLTHIQAILDRKKAGEQLTPIECHDILCHIANAVLAGGIRRAAMISLFSHDDEDMLTSKTGNWWELNEQRGRANNSVILERSSITEEEFKRLWKIVESSGAGEPGIYFTNNTDWGTNPCCEIALKPYQFCNLCDVNVSDVTSQEDLNERVSAAAFLGTLQAGFTDFHYLRDIWKRTTEEEALIGVGMTGIGSGIVLKYDLEEAARQANFINLITAKIIGINPAARVTTVKPSGTTSCVLGTSSGIHAWHNEYYTRTFRIGKNEDLYVYLSNYHPLLVEDDFFRPKTQAVVSIPQKAPKGAILRTESALDLLERTKKFNLEWVKTGHRKGDNTNNVSATISIHNLTKYYTDPIDSSTTSTVGFYEGQDGIYEWDMVGNWMWNNRDTFNGLSVLPYDGGTYQQAPFQDITEEEYNERESILKDIDLTNVIELDDNTSHSQEAACAGGKCEV